MICGTCHGRGLVFCPECLGGVAYCCEGAPPPPPRELYEDVSYPARECDHCGKTYRGPAVYCSLECALADA